MPDPQNKKNFIPLMMTRIPGLSGGGFEPAVDEKGEKKAYSESVGKITPSAISSSDRMTRDYSDTSIAYGSIAYHTVFGTIRYNSYWGFSTRTFVENMMTADENPRISAHLLHIDSNGGEAYGLHEAFETIRSLKKPVYAVIDSVAASAGYWLAAAAKKVYARSLFSTIGCIGVMMVVHNFDKWDEMNGIKEYTYYSTFSPLKNKTFTDAENGDGEELIKRMLDPLAKQFIDDVTSARGEVSKEAKEGETFYSPEAMSAGLIDGQMSLEEVVAMLTKEEEISGIDINQLNI